MKNRILVAAAGAALFVGAAAVSAFAATPAEQCTSLQKQWDTAITTHGNAPKIKTAKADHDAGVKLCGTSGKEAQGVKKLETALKDLGVKPQM